MTISKETEAEIARLYYAEHWKVGTIVAQLGVHPDVVRRVIGLPKHGVAQTDQPQVPSAIVPYVDFIRETLERYPRLRATRLWDMFRERGFKGSERTLRRFVVDVRPVGKREAFLRLNALIGEQAQIDWAHVGNISVPGGRRVAVAICDGAFVVASDVGGILFRYDSALAAAVVDAGGQLLRRHDAAMAFRQPENSSAGAPR